MDKIAQLRTRLITSSQEGGKPKQHVYAGSVVSVQGRHCTVKLASGLTVTKVKLSASINDNDGEMLMVPKQGTRVLMLSLSGTENNLSVVKADDVEYVSYKQGDLELLIDSRDGKVDIHNAQVSLVGLMDQLVQLLRTFKVHTPAGPSGTALADVVLKIDDFEMNFKKLLK